MTPTKDESPKAEKDSLTLKWGTLKRWNFESEECQALLKEYGEIGSSVSAMAQKDTQRQKEIICELIDKSNCEKIYLDWDGEYVSKEDAKNYVLTYGQSK